MSDLCGTWVNQYGNPDKMIISAVGDGTFRVDVCAESEYSKVTICSPDTEGRLPAASLWGPLVFSSAGPGWGIDNGNPEHRWKLYSERDQQNDRLAKAADLWQVLPLMDACGLKPVINTGAVHDEQDLVRSREMCLSIECGGFVVKGGEYDLQGNCIDPPRGYVYRKTQAELLQLARTVPKPIDPRAATPTLWIAPEEFVVDTGFRPGREPAPSMHIWWRSPSIDDGSRIDAFACQVCVHEPREGSYYMACGFHCGYCGIQEHRGGKKQLLFSVWDAPGCKCESLQCAEGISASGRFSGEGCGAGNHVTNCQAVYADWKAGTCYTFCVRATVEADRGASVFSCDVFTPDDCAWHRLGVTRRPHMDPVEALKPPMRGLHSFIEEFGGPKGVRKGGVYGPAWVRHEGTDCWEAATAVRTTSTCDTTVMPNQRATPTPDGRCIQLEAGGEAFDRPGPYGGSLEPSEPPPELETLP